MISLLLFVFHCAILLAVDRRNLISPVNALLIWVWLMVFRATEITVLGPLTLAETTLSYMNDELLMKALLILGLFFVFFLSGFFVPFPMSHDLTKKDRSFSAEMKVPTPFILLMAAGGVLALIEIFSQLPDLLGVVYLSEGDPGEFFKGKGLWITGLSLLPSAVLGMLLSCRTAYGFGFWALLLLCVSIIVYAPLGQRGNIFTFAIMALSLVMTKFPRMKRRYLVGFCALIFVGMGVLVLWRTAIRFNSSFDEILSDMYLSAGMDRGDFDAFAGVIAYNVSVGYESWWSFAVQLVPRFLYPSKEGYIAVSYLMDQEIIGQGTAGLTTTIVGTLYAQGGYLMVMIGAFCFGMLVKLLQNMSITKLGTPNGTLMAGVSTAFVLFLTRNGDLTNVIVMLVSNLAGVFFLMGALTVVPIWRKSWHCSPRLIASAGK